MENSKSKKILFSSVRVVMLTKDQKTRTSLLSYAHSLSISTLLCCLITSSNKTLGYVMGRGELLAMVQIRFKQAWIRD